MTFLTSNELTRILNPTKRLDKVESATGRINNINKTLEIKHNITKENTTGIGHSEHKSY